MEWKGNGGGGGGSRMSEEERTKMGLDGGGGAAVMMEDVMMGGVKVMTDEQMEMLRKQISIYATICEQLVEMHKAITATQDSLPGMRMGNLYCDPLMMSGGHKVTARQRWNPTPMQLQILESIFDQGNGTPNKQKIKEITSGLSQHGQISETNVYNWFQNRRARSKRKQTTPLPNNTDSEVETEVESQFEKKAKPEKAQSLGSPPPQVDIAFLKAAENSEVRSLISESDNAQPIIIRNDSVKSLDQISFYDSVLANPRIDHLMGKMEMPSSFNFSSEADSYDMIN